MKAWTNVLLLGSKLPLTKVMKKCKNYGQFPIWSSKLLLTELIKDAIFQIVLNLVMLLPFKIFTVA